MSESGRQHRTKWLHLLCHALPENKAGSQQQQFLNVFLEVCVMNDFSSNGSSMKTYCFFNQTKASFTFSLCWFIFLKVIKVDDDDDDDGVSSPQFPQWTLLLSCNNWLLLRILCRFEGNLAFFITNIYIWKYHHLPGFFV